MCGIAGVLDTTGALGPRGLAQADDGLRGPPRAGWRGPLRVRTGGPGPSATGDHRSVRGGARADDERGWKRHRRLQRRDLQLPAAPRRARGPGPSLHVADGHRGPRPRLRGMGGRRYPAAERDVRVRPVRPSPAAAPPGTRPLWGEAALLDLHRWQADLRIGDQVDPRSPRSVAQRLVSGPERVLQLPEHLLRPDPVRGNPPPPAGVAAHHRGEREGPAEGPHLVGLPISPRAAPNRGA